MKHLQSSKFCGDGHLKSVGTIRNYQAALTIVATEIQQNTGEALRDMEPDGAIDYLTDRATQVGQKTLDMERQALQKMMHFATFKLPVNESLPMVISEHQQVLRSRSYTSDQVAAIIKCQTQFHALSTKISYAAGLRAHELLTILPLNQQPADLRPALPMKFEGRKGVPFSVTGKGGLVREIHIPAELVNELKSVRLVESIKITDRNIHYIQDYNIGGGQRWSSSFSQASKRALGWSHGAHGLRHSYAQDRMYELGIAGYSRGLSLEIVSQEMGHFRPQITEIYLR